MKRIEIEGRTVDVISCVDAVGYFCPVPIIKLTLQIEEVKEGEVVELLADDPAILADLSAWCKATGHKLLLVTEENGVFAAYVEKQNKVCFRANSGRFL